jgi:photosystem II stability/assembly factor-like uncharacterized protein
LIGLVKMRACVLGCFLSRSLILPLASAWILLTSSASLLAGTDVWTKLNLDVLLVRLLVIDPQNPNILYVTAQSGPFSKPVYQLFKSYDRGTSWSEADLGLPVDGAVSSLVIDPQNTSTVYVGLGPVVGTGAQVFKSMDGGASWTSASIGLPGAPSLAGPANWRRVVALTIDSNNPATLFAAIDYLGNGGDVPYIFTTTDGAASWTPTTDSGLPAGGFPALVLDPQNTGSIYSASNLYGLFKSQDAGADWTEVLGLPRSCCETFSNSASVALDPQNSSTVYAAYYGGGIFSSTDAGVTWSPTGSGSAMLSVDTLAIDPQNPSVLYAATANLCYCYDDPLPSGVWRSVDGGATWAPVNMRLPIPDLPRILNTYSLAVDPQDGTVYAVTDGGIYTITFSSPLQ